MNELEKQVLRTIGEDPDSPDVFTDDPVGIAPIRDAINDAIQEVVVVTGSNKRQYYIPLRQAVQFYRIYPANGYVGWITDVYVISRKRRLEQTGLIKVTNYDPRWMVANGDPRAYFPLGNDIIGLYPKPSSDTDVLELTIVEIPEAYDGTKSRIQLKDDFQFAVVEFAVSEYWASRGDAKTANKHFDLYKQALGLRDDFDINPSRNNRFERTKEPYPKETS